MVEIAHCNDHWPSGMDRACQDGDENNFQASQPLAPSAIEFLTVLKRQWSSNWLAAPMKPVEVRTLSPH